jgi:hypothetical protein
MALRPVQVNIKAVDASAVGRFWAEALGWNAYRQGAGVTTYVGPAGGLVRPDPVAVGVDVVPVPEPKTTEELAFPASQGRPVAVLQLADDST